MLNIQQHLRNSSVLPNRISLLIDSQLLILLTTIHRIKTAWIVWELAIGQLKNDEIVLLGNDAYNNLKNSN